MLSNKKNEFEALQTQGKKLAAEGRLQDSLKLFEQAKTIYATPKVLQRIEKLKSYLTSVKSVPDSKPEAKQISKSYKEVLKERNGSNSQNVESHCLEKPVQDFQKETAFELSTEVADRKRCEVLYEEARDLATNGRCSEALKALEKAQSIYKTEKVQKQIAKLKEFIKETEESDETDDRIQISSDFSIHYEVYHALYPYQREGVEWLYSLYKKRKGGVLADDMGLGKTFQVIAFLSGMIDLDLAKHILIIMPVSLLKNWEREFKKWAPGIAVTDFHGTSKKMREKNCLRIQKRGHVLLTTYGMILTNVDTLSTFNGREFVWDYVILDEGHKIKNPTKTTKAVHDLPSKNRIVLTGTPIQNNLKELWSLFDFVHQGTLLGSLKTFKIQYENPIIRSREKDATSGEKRLGSQMSENLKDLIMPYFIRRTKSEIWNGENEVNELGKQMENMMITMPRKSDFILWTVLSEEQIEIYKSFLHSDAVKEILVSKRSPLVELTVLKKICDHPRLLSQRACLQLGLGGESQYEESSDEYLASPSIDGVTDDKLLEESGKLKIAVSLIERLRETGHKVLFFSLSRKILDMVQRILTNRKFKLMRLDGTVSKTEERERRIQEFQRNPSYSVFLLTTQVGGVGINLTAADRVIIYDPSWNPATDAQAVDRVFRIGQEKNVVIYRLITCGTVEEKIYRRQVFKDSITRQTTGDSEPYRYFSKQELRELFTFEDPYHSVTQVQLHEMHFAQRKTDEALLKHIEFLETLNLFGISDHNLMFSREVEDHTEDNDETAVSTNFINAKVATAEELIKKEASIAAEGIRIAGTFNRPYQEPVVVSKKSSKASEWYKPPPLLPVEIDLTESEDKSIYEPEISTEIRNAFDEEEDCATKQQKFPGFDVPPEIRSSFDEDCATGQETFPGFEVPSAKKNSFHEDCSGIEQQNFPKFGVPLELQNSFDDYCDSNEYIPDDVSSPVQRKSYVEVFEQPTGSRKKNGRLSCVRQLSGIIIEEEQIDDDTSQTEDSQEEQIDDDTSRTEDSQEEDSSNSASISFVPDSASSSPQNMNSKSYQSFSEIPNSPKILHGNTELGNFHQTFRGNVTRITPLKVNKDLVQKNSFFEQAMASSIVITPQASPEAIQDVSFLDAKEQSFASIYSPVQFRKKQPRQINSSSEESGDETDVVENSNVPLLSFSESKTVHKPRMSSSSSEGSETDMFENNNVPLQSLSENKMVHKHRIPSSSSEGSETEVVRNQNISLVSSEEKLTDSNVNSSCQESLDSTAEIDSEVEETDVSSIHHSVPHRRSDSQRLSSSDKRSDLEDESSSSGDDSESIFSGHSFSGSSFSGSSGDEK